MRVSEKGTLLAPTYHWTLFRARYGEACLINDSLMLSLNEILAIFS